MHNNNFCLLFKHISFHVFLHYMSSCSCDLRNTDAALLPLESLQLKSLCMPHYGSVLLLQTGNHQYNFDVWLAIFHFHLECHSHIDGRISGKSISFFIIVEPSLVFFFLEE
jgi:hypothetical protein